MNQDKHLCRCSEVLLEAPQNPSTSCTAWQAFLENASLLLAPSVSCQEHPAPIGKFDIDKDEHGRAQLPEASPQENVNNSNTQGLGNKVAWADFGREREYGVSAPSGIAREHPQGVAAHLFLHPLVSYLSEQPNAEFALHGIVSDLHEQMCFYVALDEFPLGHLLYLANPNTCGQQSNTLCL